MNEGKVCIKCLEFKEYKDYGKDSRNKDGLRGSCKVCYKLMTDKTNKIRRDNTFNKAVKECDQLRDELFSKDTKEWRYILNSNIYQASEDGEIRTVPYAYKDNNGRIKIVKSRKLKHSFRRGYYRHTITINGVAMTKGTHRWVMIAFYGESELQVDHINGIKTDNRITNLRYVNSSDNVNNVKTLNPHKYASELHGITPRRGRWESYITINNKSYFLGSYESQIEAHEKYKKAKFNWEKLGNLPKKERPKQYTSKHVGIGFHKLSNKWRLRIDGIYIGLFKTESVALRVYNICYFIKQRLKVLDKELVNKIKNKYSNYE